MLQALHRYLGLVLSLFVVIITASGALLLWSDEYHQWRYPVLGEMQNAPALNAGLLSSAIEALPVPVNAVVMPRDELPAYHFYLADGSQAFIHPLNGNVIARWDKLGSLHSWLFELHVRLLTGEPGHIAIGIAGLVIVLMVLSGLLLWWPRRRVLKLRRLFPRRTTAPRLMNAHAAQGTLLGIMIIMVALTGSGMVFSQQAEVLLLAALGSKQANRPAVNRIGDLAVANHADGSLESAATPSSEPAAAISINWAAALAAAAREFPEARMRIASLPGDSDQPLTLRLKQPDELHSNGRSYLVVHPASGAALERIDATQTGPGPAVHNALYPLHAGKTGWPAYRMLLLIVCLAMLYLALSGSWVFVRRRLKSRD